ncbi:MAG TPA: glycosyltransferase [Acidimicrobiales bacterium]|nr:glycosyltransferase [Acidimicrobiales bacterium]
MLRDLGYESEIFATAVHPLLESRVRLLHELRGPSRRDGFLLYQLSSPSRLADWLIDRLEVIGVNYHNVTPASLVHGWDRGASLALTDAALQVCQLSRISKTGICDSNFNAVDLRSKGWTSTSVAPVLVDLDGFDVEPDPTTTVRLERRREKGGIDWLFVGTISPHKAQHRLVQALALYRQVYDPKARLTLVGRPVLPSYAIALTEYVHALGLGDAVEVTGPIEHRALVAHFRAADVFVSASEHEGYCVPLLEAFYHRLPVVALAAGAVPETAGDAAVLVDDATPDCLASAVGRIFDVNEEALGRPLSGSPPLNGKTIKDVLIESSQRRLECFTLERSRAQMAAAVRAWTET